VAEGLTTNALITAARREGYKVSEHQLKNWRREGLIPRPSQSHRRGVRGSEARFPPGTLEQLLVVCRLHTHERRLTELRFDVWWEGYWIEPTMLKPSIAALLDAPLAPLRDHLERHRDPHEAALALVEAPAESPKASRSPLVRLIRARVGRDDAKLQTFVVALLTMLFGGEPVWETPDVGLDDPESDPREVVHAALGFSRAESDRLDSGDPLLVDAPDVVAVLEPLKARGVLSLDPSPRVFSTTEEELERALEHAWALADGVGALAGISELRHGRDAGGLGIVSAMERSDLRYLRALVTWIALCSGDLFATDTARDNLSAFREQGTVLRAQLELSKAFPGYRPYFTPGGEERLRALSREERDQIEQTLNAYLDSHPHLRIAVDDEGTIN
jgi:hypothetical protein